MRLSPRVELQTQLTAMEAEASEVASQLAESHVLASQLEDTNFRARKVCECAAGYSGASADRTARRHDGLSLRCAAMRVEMAPIVRRASVLALERDAARQDRVVRNIGIEKPDPRVAPRPIL